jgi:hypothetical protein
MPVKDRGGIQGREMSTIPHCLDNWLTDGGYVVSLRRWLRFIPRNISCYSLLLHFLLCSFAIFEFRWMI